MIKYTIKRLLIAIPVFLGITFIVFFLVNIAPGGPLDIMASSGELSQSDLEALRVSLGLDKPIIVRYFIWLGELFQGDLGTSYRTSQEVSLMIGQRLQASLILTAINNRDYPVIMGVTVLISVVVLVANLILDLIYAKLDPRISYD